MSRCSARTARLTGEGRRKTTRPPSSDRYAARGNRHHCLVGDAGRRSDTELGGTPEAEPAVVRRLPEEKHQWLPSRICRLEPRPNEELADPGALAIRREADRPEVEQRRAVLERHVTQNH